MRIVVLVLVGVSSLCGSLPVWAQGPTQSRDGLGSVGQGSGAPTSSANSTPAGSQNANSGAQAKPAYPSGSTSSNPGDAFVRNNPKPETGSVATPPGNLATSTTHPDGTVTTAPGSGPASGGNVTGK